MFGLSMVELAIVAILALLLLGPDQLPGMAKTLGKTLRDLRRVTDDLKGTFETEMNKLEREVEQAQQEPPKPPSPLPSLPTTSSAFEGGGAAAASAFAAPLGTPDPSATPARVPLDQLHGAQDPGALRARARTAATPKDPGAARSAARFAAHAQQLAASGAPAEAAPSGLPPALAAAAAASSTASTAASTASSSSNVANGPLAPDAPDAGPATAPVPGEPGQP